MVDMNEKHHLAMDLAARGLYERKCGNDEGALPYFIEALEYELDVIDVMDGIIQPTHAVMHRSAATLALDCNEYGLAKKLANDGLKGNPPEEIASELRDVIKLAEEKENV